MTTTLSGEFPMLKPEEAPPEVPEQPGNSADRVRRIGSLAG
jgi:hypothetical protein